MQGESLALFQEIMKLQENLNSLKKQKYYQNAKQEMQAIRNLQEKQNTLIIQFLNSKNVNNSINSHQFYDAVKQIEKLKV